MELKIKATLNLGQHSNRRIFIETDSLEDHSQILEQFIREGWPSDKDGRLLGSDYIGIEWLPVEVIVSFPRQWLLRVRQAQKEYDALQREYESVPLPPEHFSERERVQYWDRIEDEHHFYKREEQIIERLDDGPCWQQ